MATGPSTNPWSNRSTAFPIIGALAALSVVTWAVTIWQASDGAALMMTGVPMSIGMSGRLAWESAAAFLAIWLVMMAAMMFPSVWPAVLAYGNIGKRRGDASVALFTAGYLVVWEVVGVVAYLGYIGLGTLLASNSALMGRLPIITGGLVVVAGLYQFTVVKTSCLSECQSPAAYLNAHWQQGAAGALRLGMRHGTFCLGCCWGLMLVLFALGAMDLRWMVAVAALIAVEKLGPRARFIPQIVGVGLVVVGIVVAVTTQTGMAGMAM